MSDLLRIILDTALFFVTCTAIFLFGFIVDAIVQTRRAAQSRADAANQADRTAGHGDAAMKHRSAATA